MPSHPISSRFILIFAHLCIGLLSCLSPSSLSTKTLHAHLFSPTHATRPVWLIILDIIILKLCAEQYKLCISLLSKFLQPFSTFPLSGPNMFPSTLFSNSCSLCSPLMWETKFHTHLRQQTELSMYFNLHVLDNQCGQKTLHYQYFYWMFSIMVVVDLWVHLNTLKIDTKLSQKVGQ
jgi:hypothetical protein